MSKSINGEYARRLKAIRPFVNFNFDLRKPLSKYQKSKINNYFKEIDALTHRPYHVYRTKSKAKLKKAQEFAQHEKQLPGLKVAFIPVADLEQAPEIRFTKSGDMVVKSRHVNMRHLSLDLKKLIDDPVAHVNSVIKRDKEAKRFQILAGKYEIPTTFGRAFIADEVAKHCAKYADDTKNNYFGNWLHGLNALHFENQASLDDYAEAKEKAKAAVKRKKKAAKTKNKRK